MNWNKTKVSSRLMIGFATLTAALVAVSAVAVYELGEINQQITELVDERMVKMRQFTELKDNLSTISRVARNVVLISDAGEDAVEAQRIGPLQARNSELLAELHKTLALPKALALLGTIDSARPAYDKRLDEALKLGMSDNPEDIKAATAIVIGDLRAKQVALFQAVDESLALQQAASKDIAEQASQTATFTTGLVLSIAAAATLLALFLAFAISRKIVRQLGAEPDDLSDAVTRIANAT
jgi:methyl-accepting chemotaxis protein